MQSDFSQGKVWKNVINQAIPYGRTAYTDSV